MLKVDGNTKIFAVLGNPIEQTLSPAMYNAAFSALNINCIYVPVKIERNGLKKAVQCLKTFGIQGGNVTIPFKKDIMCYMDEVTEEARLIGAVNTFYWKNDSLWGDNTDGAGFIAALREVNSDILKDRGALIMGAGGAARAVAVTLGLLGMKNITIVNRTRERAKELANLLIRLGCAVSVRDWQNEGLKEVFRENRLIVNTTPLGMYPHEEESPPVNKIWLRKEHFIVDLIYKPRETLLLQKAKARGCQTLNGLPMLLKQGVLSFEKWSGHKAPEDVMASELKKWV